MDRPRIDPDYLRDAHELLEKHLLGEAPSLTSREVADEVGISLEVAQERWRSLGFTAIDPDDVRFTSADVEALRLVEEMASFGFVDEDSESALIRSVGRGYARLAEWQIGLLARRALEMGLTDLDELGGLMEATTTPLQKLQNYAWRRHLVAAGSRLMLTPEAVDDQASIAVGFADIVGYTSRARSLGSKELTSLVDGFEARAQSLLSERKGRIVKSIGDEVMFTIDNPGDAAEVALLLAEEHLRDEDFPQLRVGVAWGQVVSHVGDIFGPVVNVAARMTGLARPGRVLIDRLLAEQLEGHDEYRLRKLRRTSVKGYRHIEPWSLRRPPSEDPLVTDDGAYPGPASAFIADRGEEIVRAIRGD